MGSVWGLVLVVAGAIAALGGSFLMDLCTGWVEGFWGPQCVYEYHDLGLTVVLGGVLVAFVGFLLLVAGPSREARAPK